MRRFVQDPEPMSIGVCTEVAAVMVDCCLLGYKEKEEEEEDVAISITFFAASSRRSHFRFCAWARGSSRTEFAAAVDKGSTALSMMCSDARKGAAERGKRASVAVEDVTVEEEVEEKEEDESRISGSPQYRLCTDEKLR